MEQDGQSLGTPRGSSWQEDEYRRLMGDDAADRQARAAGALRCSCARKRELTGAHKGAHHHPTCAFFC